MRAIVRSATLRLLGFLGAGLALSLVGSTRILLGALAAVALLAVHRRLPGRDWRLLGWTCLAPLPGFGILFLLAGHEATGAWQPALAWGLARLVPYVARIAVLMGLNLLYVQATPLPELLAALRGLPIPGQAALLLATLMRFLPTALGEARRIVEAQRCRGLDLKRLWTPAGLVALAVPLFLAQVKRSHDLALCLEIRGFAGADGTGSATHPEGGDDVAPAFE